MMLLFLKELLLVSAIVLRTNEHKYGVFTEESSEGK